MIKKIEITKQTDNFFESYFRLLFADSKIKLTDTDFKLLALTAEYKNFDVKIFSGLLDTDSFSLNNFKSKLRKKNLLIKKDNTYIINDKVLNNALSKVNKYRITIEYDEKEGDNIPVSTKI